MSLAILIDMNLSPDWVEVLALNGFDAIHWSTVGDPRALDTEIMTWARQHRRIVFTHDLDFGAILALTHADGPSVLQVRGQNVLPAHMSGFVLAALRQYGAALFSGAIVVVDEGRSRARVLPL